MDVLMLQPIHVTAKMMASVPYNFLTPWYTFLSNPINRVKIADYVDSKFFKVEAYVKD